MTSRKDLDLEGERGKDWDSSREIPFKRAKKQ